LVPSIPVTTPILAGASTIISTQCGSPLVQHRDEHTGSALWLPTASVCLGKWLKHSASVPHKENKDKDYPCAQGPLGIKWAMQGKSAFLALNRDKLLWQLWWPQSILFSPIPYEETQACDVKV
jgi:hypothetical protein